MAYQDPRAYLVGLEGLALLRAWGGEFDQEFVEARLAEVRRLLEDDALAARAVTVERAPIQAGYAQWAATYDEPRNSLFDLDEPLVHEILGRLPAGDALDAACGTGRFSQFLLARGHRVTGVDNSPDMLARARARVPGARFVAGELTDLPVPADSIDVVVCALALVHVPDLRPVMAEFARVLRPGGHLVISDVHHEQVFRGSVVKALGPTGKFGLVPTYRHAPGDFLRAALPVGLQVRRCEEPVPPLSPPPKEAGDGPVDPGEWPQWPWSLMDIVPQATWAACQTPSVIVWHFQQAVVGH